MMERIFSKSSWIRSRNRKNELEGEEVEMSRENVNIEVIKKLKNGKALRNDKVRAEVGKKVE